MLTALSVNCRSSRLVYPCTDFDYKLIDAGDFKKLELLGSHYIVRPAPQAIWPRKLAEEEWQKSEAEYEYFKGKETGGSWNFYSLFPEEGWTLKFQDLSLKVNPTGFGHIGLFAEQAPNWLWIREQTKQIKDANILNLFGYTGASTLSAAAGGARVTHIDASKPSIAWARQNQELSGLGDSPIRWIVDDAVKFLKREIRRGNRYNGIVMDPPTFGRGTKNEVWKIEKNLPELLQLCRKILVPEPSFILITTHSPGFSSLTLENLLLSYLIAPGQGEIESGEMFILEDKFNTTLPSGFFSRWVQS
jgi:23S rRNA (cytosine1962-C5)-methyltransferase